MISFSVMLQIQLLMVLLKWQFPTWTLLLQSVCQVINPDLNEVVQPENAVHDGSAGLFTTASQSIPVIEHVQTFNIPSQVNQAPTLHVHVNQATRLLLSTIKHKYFLLISFLLISGHPPGKPLWWSWDFLFKQKDTCGQFILQDWWWCQ